MITAGKRSLHLIKYSKQSIFNGRPQSYPQEDTPLMAIVQELLPMPDAEAVFLRLAALPHCLFLDSAMRLENLGRYSFICADPFEYLEIHPREKDELSELEAVWQKVTAGHEIETLAGLPPFQGGVAGLFSYDLGYSLETLPNPHCDEFQVPSLAVGFYDVVVAFDHHEQRAWIISQGLPEQEPIARANRALERAAYFQQILSGPVAPFPANEPTCEIAAEHLAVQHEVRGSLTSNFSKEDYLLEGFDGEKPTRYDKEIQERVPVNINALATIGSNDFRWCVMQEWVPGDCFFGTYPVKSQGEIIKGKFKCVLKVKR